ncbi:Hpt domain-containing protein [Xinfangfangia sp. CPCC 101601]|uniref:Hpt domain-containing protein n=1 Tax=Pseudogemmobacter lacusdianii TaxID=3069608 RepID=A0ABU0VTM9_9RHOB|nr:Hpt domain-containing protein [Xinfangfangia sp. CPCC 101601]MDQ2065084.1 Hpt domain-containing protein [Xinfangfangia sp. CPCC 101601]
MLLLGPQYGVSQTQSDPLAPIRRRFLTTVDQHCQDVAQLIQDTAEPALSRDAWNDIGLIAHRVAGVAATLGFEDLGRIAAELDQKIGTAMKAERVDLAGLSGTVALFQSQLLKAQAKTAD